MLLVIAVVFLFLRGGRATFIPPSPTPVSLIGTCTVFCLCGYSLDSLSSALAMRKRFVVDDAIVVMNIEEGLTPYRRRWRTPQVGSPFCRSCFIVASAIPLLFWAAKDHSEVAITLSCDSRVLVCLGVLPCCARVF